ncbi:uncharacterized protein LOC131692853 isoform X2 [Topomyia yanbarensis]|nr:uncharacterized protein LOC131692853 isoform X2 [Topomyia yanbarensis]XP_058836167.1 uncharacterized protein LOC131692853 isoform X2 [Topomyia yanbarensis]XP_058836168.1 uncharacterized protein LOC131692853 isoform X2 [Topomyia yanbarensis]XP_058836169.1 uncharacterized protein LOC131692853 isoform X2 [Topomyia yanbarensis]XP_058836170.1 uncharacterized protein LOC131692853 isoform X2 [Topomyia yanbarensis]XP_058836171.1 uncharacterized protein LOC131692853 isoform X2 [Topomyia yanbarensis]
MRCFVPKCTNREIQGEARPSVSFHRAPKNPDVRIQWFSFCRLKYDSVVNLRIGSAHFKSEDFESNDFRRAFFGKQRRLLVKNAKPSIRCPPFMRESDADKAETQVNGLSLLMQAVSFVEQTDALDDSPEIDSPHIVPTLDNDDESQTNDVSILIKAAAYIENVVVPDSTLFPRIESDAVAVSKLCCNVEQSSTPSTDSYRYVSTMVGQKLVVETCPDEPPAAYVEKPLPVERSLNQMAICHDHTYIASLETKSSESFDALYSKTIEDDLKQEKAFSRRLIKELAEVHEKLHKERIASANELKVRQKEMRMKEEQIHTLRSACVELNVIKEGIILNRIKETMGKILTPNQIDLLLGLKKKVHWTAEEIALSFTIRYHGKSAWNLIKKELNFPLPSLKTMQEWSSRIKMNVGILEDVLRLMKIAATNYTERDRVAILSFDEMSVDDTFEYDSRSDTAIGPHKNIQVAMARGLFAQWKQPVYAAFDAKMTSEILENIIFALHRAGFNVVGCVSDCGGGNQGLWSTLGVNHEHTHIIHPITGENVYFLLMFHIC